MTSASISDLQANLSRYLREVRRGGEVEILDGGAPVARLVPPAADEGDRERAGLLRPGRGSAAAVLDTPPLALPVSLSAALDEDRADRSPAWTPAFRELAGAAADFPRLSDLPPVEPGPDFDG